MSTITIDDLHFELRGSDQRRSLQVTVDRDGDLILFAPPGCDEATLEASSARSASGSIASSPRRSS